MTTFTYPQWLERRIARRSAEYPFPDSPVSFSLLTLVYERSDARFFADLARCVFDQCCPRFEWIVLAQGALSSDVEDVLAEINTHGECRILREERNLGIISGLQRCLTASTNDYVLPIDADDLLTPDALQIMAASIHGHHRPVLLYSDEDCLVDGIPSTPYLRPDWDPVLALSRSYIWHLSAIDRAIALRLGAYTDSEANWCHDWDTVLRVATAGAIVHVPEVLYHWRQHSGSSTNRANPESASLGSQRHVLQHWVETHPDPELFSVEKLPMNGGAPGYWIARRPVSPPSLTLLVYGTDHAALVTSVCSALRSSAARTVSEIHLVGISDLTAEGRARIKELTGSSATRIVVWPQARPYDLVLALANSSVTVVAVVSANVTVEQGWMWEADRLLRLHPEVAIVAAQILADSGLVLSGGEVFGFGGILGSPDAGRQKTDGGPYGIALNARTVSAPHPWFFVARRLNLVEALRVIPIKTTWATLGAWLGGVCAENAQLVAFSPSLNAVRQTSEPIRPSFSERESAAFAHRFIRFIPDLRGYSRWYSWMADETYTIRAAG